MKGKLCFLVLALALTLNIDARPAGESDSALETLQARMGDTLSEIEWLLHQLVNILSDMVDGIEKEPSLLQNYHFRQILIQVIKRIDYILEHFENVGASMLSSPVVYELQRVDCVRIRLANYISQSKKFDDSQCRAQSGHKKPGQAPTDEQIVPLLTQIVTILVKVTQQLDYIASIKEQLRPSPTPSNPWGTTTQAPLWTPGVTVNWEDLISQFVSSKPNTVPNNNNGGGSTPAPGLTSTQNWNDLISQVMDGMGGTLTPATSRPVTAATPSSGSSMESSTAWEDVMNDLIGQWTGAGTTAAPSNNMDVQQCVDSILSIINTIQSQLPNGTLPGTQN